MSLVFSLIFPLLLAMASTRSTIGEQITDLCKHNGQISKNTILRERSQEQNSMYYTEAFKCTVCDSTEHSVLVYTKRTQRYRFLSLGIGYINCKGTRKNVLSDAKLYHNCAGNYISNCLIQNSQNCTIVKMGKTVGPAEGHGRYKRKTSSSHRRGFCLHPAFDRGYV